ncbi:MAG: diaminopimelate epimerase [Gemmatimonadales bacterium]
MNSRDFARSAFYKMTGSGNDFVFVDGRTSPIDEWPAERIRSICDRRTGVGGDGLVVLSPEGDDAVRMVYFNADGSRAGMCGNAALCSTRLAARLGLVPEPGMLLHTDTGVLQTRCVGPGWAAELLLPDFALPAPAQPELVPGERWMQFCSVGVPHVIVGVEDVTTVDVATRGRGLRYDIAFGPAGANINFVSRVVGARPEDPGWVLRTYERGVEAETLACGTGTVAAAFALARSGLDHLPVRIRSWGGNVFSVAGRIDGGSAMAREPWLCGEGRLVFEGVLADH